VSTSPIVASLQSQVCVGVWGGVQAHHSTPQHPPPSAHLTTAVTCCSCCCCPCTRHQVVMWLGAAVSALAATRACLQWEPLVVPPMPGQPPTPPLPPMASVNLTTVSESVTLWCSMCHTLCLL
jgi:hypothetical protein